MSTVGDNQGCVYAGGLELLHKELILLHRYDESCSP
jgi:hypothetical protein